MKNRCPWGVSGALLVLLCVGCWPGKRTEDLRQGITIRLSHEPESYQWVKTTDTQAFRLIPALLEALAHVDSHGTLIPGCGRNWSTSPDGRTVSVQIAPGKTWSDGTPVTSADFARALKWILDPQNGSPTASLFHGVLESQGVETPDSSTLKFHLKSPAGYFESLLSSVFPVHARENLEAQTPQFTNGDYAVESVKPHVGITLKRRFPAEHAPSKIEFLYVEEDSTALRLLETGKIHILEKPPWMDFERLTREKPEWVHVFPTMRLIYLSLNPQHPELKDLARRRQLMNLMSSQKISDLARGLWRPALSVVPEEFFPPKTAALLRHREVPVSVAHTSPSREHGVQEKQKKPSENPNELTLLISNREGDRLIAEHLQEQFRLEGWKLHVWALDWKAYLIERKKPSASLVLAAWNGSHPHPHTFLELFLPLPHLHIHATHPDYSKWIVSRNWGDLLRATQEVTDVEAIVKPLVRENLVLVMDPRLGGVEVNAFSEVTYGAIRVR